MDEQYRRETLSQLHPPRALLLATGSQVKQQISVSSWVPDSVPSDSSMLFHLIQYLQNSMVMKLGLTEFTSAFRDCQLVIQVCLTLQATLYFNLVGKLSQNIVSFSFLKFSSIADIALKAIPGKGLLTHFVRVTSLKATIQLVASFNVLTKLSHRMGNHPKMIFRDILKQEFCC